ncbi:MAG: lycopene cyclase [Saprospiraceae bacterium]|nr:lycopene cyclase [Saprospiraceae bacterium]
MKHFDYIITGAGGAGLSLIHHLGKSPLKDKKILVIDKDAKDTNDRTWCFWEDRPGPFDDIVYRSWSELSFHSDTFSKDFQIDPFKYKMIRGIDFYRYVQEKTIAQSNIEWLQAEVQDIAMEGGKVVVKAAGQSFQADWCFNSILFQAINKQESNYLDQHFKGWVVETEEAVFSPGRATLMDFRVPQEGETRFLYVLPIDERRALVEVAIFSNNILASQEYDEILDQYIKHHITKQEYAVIHEEFGIIPMTDYPFIRSEDRVVHIGTAGGDTKASTGYTFWRMQKHLQQLVDQFVNTGIPSIEPTTWQKRFQLYDSTLLRVLEEDRLAGDVLFTHLFRKNPPQRLLRFLNDESHFAEEIALMSSVPTLPFLRSFITEVSKKRIPTRSNLPTWEYGRTTAAS